MWNKNERDGKIDQAKGRVKQAVGDLTNNDDLKSKGKSDEATGKIEVAVGKARRKAGAAIDGLIEAAKK